MATVTVGPFDLGYGHTPGASGVTFVFVNALTGTGAMWEEAIAPALRDRGHGTLTFDLPGQAQSPPAPDRTLDASDLVTATAGVTRALRPSTPVFVGLSIGGLFALRAHLDHGVPAAGFVLVNTLRKAGARLAWINDSVLRLAEVGGAHLLKDAFAPLLFGPHWLAANRTGALEPVPYEALGTKDAERKLLAAGCGADWDLAYERVRAPVVVLSGLEDRVFYDAAAVDELSRRLPDAMRIDIQDAGHLLPVESPDAVVTACLSIVGRLERG